MKSPLLLALLLALCMSNLSAQDSPVQRRPIQVLLVAGGCCHDYATQTRLIKEGIEKRIHARVTVEFNPSTEKDFQFRVYSKPGWASDYDVIIHDECTAAVKDKEYVDRILEAHRQGVPAVNLHCAMHSFRWGEYQQPVADGADNAGWYEMIGLQSTRHGPRTPIEIEFADSGSPIITGMKDWKTTDEELYNNVRIFDSAKALAYGSQMQPPRKAELKKNPDAKPKEAKSVVVWTNEFGPKKTRIFSTTLGHTNETVGDERYLDLITRGVLWASANLNDDGQPAAGYGPK